jgi:spermidine synthase
MIPRVLVDTAQIPGGGGELRLIQRGSEYSIMLGANELMNSRLSGSEEALAREACARLGSVKAPKLLIGGLGMGFTLRAALAVLGPDANLTVTELVPAVVRWARGPMAHLYGDSLDDPRVTMLEVDVADRIASAAGDYDAILLDVDNGPDGLTLEANDRLYSADGLAQARAALRPGGILAIWSAKGDPRFTRRLERAGFGVEELEVRGRGGKRGAHHLIWFAKKLG